MKTFIASIIALGLVSGVASASELTQIATSVLEYCPPSYYGW